MQQILYMSSSTVVGDKADLAGILQQSRHNNAIDSVTGLLWSDGEHFLQVFEGPRESVAATALRIWADPRHHDIRIVHDKPIQRREFGDWTMAHRRANEPADMYQAQMKRVLSNASVSVSAPFHAMIATGRSAA